MPTLDATSLSRDERALLKRFADRLVEHPSSLEAVEAMFA